MRKLLLPTLAFLLSGCSIVPNTYQVSRNPVPELAYQSGRPAVITNLRTGRDMEEQEFKKPPQRLVCVWQNSIETPIALGVGDRIVAGMGVYNESIIKEEYREQYRRIPVKGIENLDQETVLMLEPDMIIGWYSTFTAKYLRSTDFWHKRGVGTYIAVSSAWLPEGQLLENEYNDILNLGKILDREQEAKGLVEAMQAELAAVAERTRTLKKRPRALIMGGMGRQLGVYGAKSLAGDLVKRLNGELLAADARTISAEQVIELNPDVIFYLVGENRYQQMDELVEQVYKINGFQNLSCVRNRRIIGLPLNAIYTPGVRTMDGIKIMAHGLYPEFYAAPAVFK